MTGLKRNKNGEDAECGADEAVDGDTCAVCAGAYQNGKGDGGILGWKGMCTQEPKREEEQQESVATEGRRSTRKKQATRVYGRDGVDARSDKVKNPRSLQHFSAVLLLFGDGVRFW